ncbi:PREDICTED: kelch-like protein 12 [Branchiostoma belcheri]|uniref:Kelch-like protein 12 n=1 Tax=Branchiostoma belcheri TaxID=7741 RepID=A0A6P4ZSK7_BRABE|nr:PREDICTED: kelch-like protein 12 [Branchiostoma belcheri]
MAACGDDEKFPLDSELVHPCFFQDESFQPGFLETVKDLQKNGVLQDVVLEVEGRQFPCHRLVLSVASPYFRAMFTSGMAESRQKTVILQGLNAAVFKEILSYIYSGCLQVSLDRVQHLYQAADLLQLDYVRDTCSSYMDMEVGCSTCVDLYKFGDLFSLDTVRESCLQCIYKHFTKVSSSEEFCSLSVDQLTEIISHDELDVKEETTVWEAVVRWVQHSREDRTHHIPSILPHIRFDLLTPRDMVAILDHPLVREDPGRSTIRNVVNESSNLKRRHGMDTLEMAIIPVYGSGQMTDQMVFMNPRAGEYITWSHRPENYEENPVPIIAMTVTSDNDIYILQEVTENIDENQLNMLKYNHARNRWEDAVIFPIFLPKPVNHVHYSLFLVEVDRILYFLAVDSYNTGASALVHIEKYNQHVDRWHDCSQLLIDKVTRPIGDILVVSSGPYIYFLTNAEMHSYDPSQDRWSKLTPPKLMPGICTATSLGTEIFCTDKQFSKVMAYDTESAHWRVLPGWPNRGPDRAANKYPCLFVLESQLHVWLETCVMSTDTVDGSLVFVYDGSEGAWRDLNATLPIKDYDTRVHVARFHLPRLTARGLHEDT